MPLNPNYECRSAVYIHTRHTLTLMTVDRGLVYSTTIYVNMIKTRSTRSKTYERSGGSVRIIHGSHFIEIEINYYLFYINNNINEHLIVT